MVKLGTNLPEHLIGTDHGALAEFLQGIEELGYGYITIGDHVLGADLERAAGLEAVPRQAAALRPAHAVARAARALRVPHRDHQHARVEHRHPGRTATAGRAAGQAGRGGRHPLGGRLRLVIAAGWNDVEFEAMGVDFATRQDHGRAGRTDAEALDGGTRRLLRQVPHRQRRRHQPAPVQRPIPLWFGGQSPVVLKRTGRLADGWFPYYPAFDPVKLAQTSR